MFAQQEVIRPSADLRNHYNEISRQCREDNEADEDVKYGRVAPMKDTFDDLRSLLKEGRFEVRSNTNRYSGFFDSKNRPLCC